LDEIEGGGRRVVEKTESALRASSFLGVRPRGALMFSVRPPSGMDQILTLGMGPDGLGDSGHSHTQEKNAV